MYILWELGAARVFFSFEIPGWFEDLPPVTGEEISALRGILPLERSAGPHFVRVLNRRLVQDDWTWMVHATLIDRVANCCGVDHGFDV